jgi:type IV pilus assembly protein PilA
MWLNALFYWIVLPVALVLLSVGIALVAGEGAANIFYYATYFVIAFVLAPMFANRLYYQHAQKKISKVAAATSSAEQQSAELARIGGTSRIVLVLAPLFLVAIIGMLAAIAIPAYQDYTIRAQISEGLKLSGGAKAAVAEMFSEHGQWPVDNGSAGLPEPQDLSGVYVSSIAVDQGTIVVTYGNEANSIIQDETLLLHPVAESDDTVRWVCESPSIEAKHLPAACR